LKTIQSKLEGIYQKQQTERKAQNKIAQETKEEYQQLLEKRNDYRKETYGFTRTNLGWINIDKGTNSKDWQPEELEILIHDGASFNIVQSYLIYTSIKSLYQLNTSDNITFKTGDKNSNTANMPKNKMAVSISIGYKGETSYLAIKEFKVRTEKQFLFNLKVSALKDIKKALKVYYSYSTENKIDKDLAFMETLIEEEKRIGGIEKEELFLMKLIPKIYPCFIAEYQSEVERN
jgi:hypothetical protein